MISKHFNSLSKDYAHTLGQTHLRRHSTSSSSQAQGTIEYLVIIGVVVILSLVVVSLVTETTDSRVEVSNNSSSITSKIGSGGISVVESVANTEGDLLISFQNNTGDNVTLKKITAIDSQGNEEDQNYNNNISLLQTELFQVNDTSCICEEGEESKTCNFKLEYLTQDGLEKVEFVSISADCIDNIVAKKPPIPPIDNTPPSIILTSPEDNVNVTSKSVSFSFTIQDKSDISSCTLITENDSNTYTGLQTGNNTIIYAFENDFLTDWNISCTDASNNTGHSSTRTLDIDSNDYQITTCLELQEIRNNLNGDYELMQNIDCEGTYFEPIQTISYAGCDGVHLCFPEYFPFTGSLDGKGYKISNLTTTQSMQGGLFGNTSNTTIQNLGLENVNINCIEPVETTGGCGGVVAVFSGTISQVYVTGTITSTGGGIGGLIGQNTSYYQISNSYFNGNIIITGEYYEGAGGIVGGGNLLTITNSYASGTFQQGGGYPDIGLGGETEVNSFSTINKTPEEITPYYGAVGLPFASLGWSDIIWTPRDNNYPILAWQNN